MTDGGGGGSSQFGGALLGLYRLAQESAIDEFQDAALKLLKRTLPFDSSMWGTATASAAGIDIHTIHLHEEPPEMLSLYETLKQHDHAAQAMFGQRRVTHRFHARSWWGEPRHREFLDYLQRFGHENMLITAANDPQTKLVQWVSLYRADPEAHCSEAERLLLDELAPHLMQALTFNRATHLSRAHGAPPAGSATGGAAIADLRGTLYHREPAFTRLVEQDWPGWRGHTLPPPMLDALRRGERRFGGHRLVMAGRVEHALLFLRARPLCAADLLSPREQVIAALAAKGSTHKEIAQMLNRSPATVRNQIQSIYDKLEVGNVAQLINELRQAD